MTASLLGTFEKDPKFASYCAQWESRGRTIKTAKDLIACYYHGFQVISIPVYAKTPTTALGVCKKVRALYQSIDELSKGVNLQRKKQGMELDIATFSSYFTRAAKILARDHRLSIDFRSLSEHDGPLPRRFSEHMVLLLQNVAKLRGLETTQAIGGEDKLIFDVIPYLACVIQGQFLAMSHKDSKHLPLLPALFLYDR